MQVHSKIKSIPFTQQAYEKLSSDLSAYNKEKELILVRLQTAREMGDLSENGAYKYAKFELGRVNREIRRLTYQLRHGFVQKPSRAGTIEFGSVITIENETTKITFTLVSHHESNPAVNKLSTDSPLGKAVIGKKIGDKVSVVAPAGNKEFTIASVS